MDIWLHQLGNPTLLFFLLGILAILCRSDLEVPPAITQFLSLYLLLAIGFKGGQELKVTSLQWEHFPLFIIGLGSAIIIPVLVFFLLKKHFGLFNAGAIAASYGSVSAVTFVAATQFVELQKQQFDGILVAVMAAMEAPAIIVGVLLILYFNKSKGRSSILSILHHSVSNASVFILLGSFLIGVLTDSKGAEGIKPFTSDLFKGFLSLFLLNMGMTTAKKLKGFMEHGVFASVFALSSPLVIGSFVAYVSTLWIANPANSFILAVLAASASYIAVPAAMSKSVPEADAGLFVPMAIGITFPVNLILGMPLFWKIISY